jgi:hypothetical protein
MAYDAATKSVIMFGGSNVLPVSYTWSWDGHSWTQLHPVHSPPARQGAAMAYDPSRQVVLMFGGSGYSIGDESKSGPDGSDHSTSYSDTWSWNGSDWQRLSISFVGTGQDPVQPDPAMAWDASDGSMVLDEICPGAYTCFQGNSRTWEWDWTSLSWTHVPTPGPIPWDAAGQGDTSPPDLISGGWLSAFKPLAYPGYSRAISSDPANGDVFFSAQGQTNQFFAQNVASIDHTNVENWRWSGNSWHPLTVSGAGSTPSGASTGNISGNSLPLPKLAPTADSRLLLFDGWGESWIWDGAGWTKWSGTSPGWRGGAAMAFDAATGEDVLFGGQATADRQLFADTWVWGSQGWRRVAGPPGSVLAGPLPVQSDPPASIGAKNCRADANAAAANGPFARYLTTSVILMRNRDLATLGMSDPGQVQGQQILTQPGRLVCGVLQECKWGLPCIQSRGLGFGGASALTWTWAEFDPLYPPNTGGGFSGGIGGGGGAGEPPDLSRVTNLLGNST